MGSSREDSLFKLLPQKRIEIMVFREIRNRIDSGKPIDGEEIYAAVTSSILSGNKKITQSPEQASYIQESIDKAFDRIQKRVGNFEPEAMTPDDLKKAYADAAKTYDLVYDLIRLRDEYLKNNKSINSQAINQLISRAFAILDSDVSNEEKRRLIIAEMEKEFEKEKQHYLSVPWNRGKNVEDFENILSKIHGTKKNISYQYAARLYNIPQFKAFRQEKDKEHIRSLVKQIKDNNTLHSETEDLFKKNGIDIDVLKKYMQLHYTPDISTEDDKDNTFGLKMSKDKHQWLKDLHKMGESQAKFLTTLNELALLMREKPGDPKIAELVSQLNTLTNKSVEQETKQREYKELHKEKGQETSGAYETIIDGESKKEIGDPLIKLLASKLRVTSGQIDQLEERMANNEKLDTGSIKTIYENLNFRANGHLLAITITIQNKLAEQGIHVEKITGDELRKLAENPKAVDALKDFVSLEGIHELAKVVDQYSDLSKRLDNISKYITNIEEYGIKPQPTQGPQSYQTPTEYLFDAKNLYISLDLREGEKIKINQTILHYKAEFKLNKFKDYESSGEFEEYKKQHQSELDRFTKDTHQAAKPFVKDVSNPSMSKGDGLAKVAMTDPTVAVSLLDALRNLLANHADYYAKIAHSKTIDQYIKILKSDDSIEEKFKQIVAAANDAMERRRNAGPAGLKYKGKMHEITELHKIITQFVTDPPQAYTKLQIIDGLITKIDQNHSDEKKAKLKDQTPAAPTEEQHRGLRK